MSTFLTDYRYLTFVNNYFALWALLSPWVNVGSGSTIQHINIWEAIDAFSVSNEYFKSIGAMLVVSFAASIFVHWAFVSKDWIAGKYKKTQFNMVVFLLCMIDIVACVLTLVFWVIKQSDTPVTDNMKYFFVGFYANAIHVGTSICLLPMLMYNKDDLIN